VNAAAIIQILQRAVPGVAYEVASSSDQPSIHVPREAIVQTSLALRDMPELQFSFLAELTAVDYLPSEPRFEVVYQLACLGAPGFPTDQPSTPKRLRLKVRVPGADARIPTVTGVWPAANWLEREVWDLVGIVFDGHPDLRRLLMPEDWQGHPLRKDYPVQIELAARSTEALQLTPEQFAANIAAARRKTQA